MKSRGVLLTVYVATHKVYNKSLQSSSPKPMVKYGRRDLGVGEEEYRWKGGGGSSDPGVGG